MTTSLTPPPHEAPLRQQDLSARFDVAQPEVLISGSQALLRMLLSQRTLDQRAGLNTAGYVSGYRGSPLGGLDLALWKAGASLKAADIVFQPGINEELALTAVSGTQQLAAYGPARVDGVFGLWYGKGPGVDRAGDALKHASYAGTHPQGGALAVFGDDHPGKSSSVAHHSEQAMATHGVPVLYPSNVQEVLEYGLLGFAMSRYSGAWVGMKMVNETAEQTAVAKLDLAAFMPTLPPSEDLLPPEGVHYRGVYGPLRDEEIVQQHRLPLAQRFARANQLDRVTVGDAGPLGIVTAGKAYQDVRQALRMLGLEGQRARTLGVAVYKVGMIWPLEPSGLREFAEGRTELLFIEEKAAFLELQAAPLLYNDPVRPAIVGKHDLQGKPLQSAEKSLEPAEVALVIAARLHALGLADAALEERAQSLRTWRRALLNIVSDSERRLPYFCSGCPHNASTVLPEGSDAIAGIGCHGMAMWAKPRTHLSTQMGGEGMNWAGLAPFSRTRHLFQNLGDGTFFHSGSLAIRAAIASGVNITYKILFNDAVAMTGGQPVDGQISVAQVAQGLLNEGVRRVIVLTEDLSRYAGSDALPAGVDAFDRRELQRVQKELRDVPGCTALVYDQTCAAEKRRRRKKKEYPDPDQRIFINPDVCEGCGDCSVQSGCVSIEPLDTPLGRKRQINQSSCNKDYSCVQGFCPSFVTVRGGQLKRSAHIDIPEALLARLPVPATAPLPQGSYGVILAGIGGTGVVTVGAVLAMAAYLEHKAPSTYDMTGLSQKNGAVYSHIRIAARPQDIHSQRIGQGDASLVLAFDLVAALSDESWRTFGDTTCVVGNARVQETAAFVTNAQARVEPDVMQRKILQRVPEQRTSFVDATGIAQDLFGDTVAANMFLLGVAAQRGWLPVGMGALKRALELNGVQVDFNKRALQTGRLWVVDPEWVASAARASQPQAQAQVPVARVDETLDALVAQGEARLTRYLNAAYARRFRELVDIVSKAEQTVSPGSDVLASAVARQFARLMAYKDEYEVARLYSLPEFEERIRAQMEGNLRLSVHLAPPLFARRDPQTGQPLKREFGGWILPAMRLLARFKGLRGTALDPFGYTAERRAERDLISQYEETMRTVAEGLTLDRLQKGVALANVPEGIRGYGHVKEAAMTIASSKRKALLQAFGEGGGKVTSTVQVENQAA